MGILNITISGLEGVQNDFETERNKINARIPAALEYVGSEMASALDSHLVSDWYAPWEPAVYERRSDGAGGFPGLLSGEYTRRAVKGNTLWFAFTPSGAYEPPIWNTRSGDELIESIQTGELAGDPPPRPFWNRFVDDMEDHGIINAFVSGMGTHFPIIPEGKGRDLRLDGNERLRAQEELRV